MRTSRKPAELLSLGGPPGKEAFGAFSLSETRTDQLALEHVSRGTVALGKVRPAQLTHHDRFGCSGQRLTTLRRRNIAASTVWPPRKALGFRATSQ
jgi:hypothetical protein